MNNWFIYIPLAFVLMSYLSSLKSFRLDMHVAYKLFSYFLLTTFIAESFGIAWPRWLYKAGGFERSNQWFYNIFHILSYMFYFLFFKALVNSSQLKFTCLIISRTYLLFAIGNLCFLQGLLWLNTYSDLLGSLCIVTICIAYYYELLYAKEVISLTNNPLFWIGTGLFVYHLGSSTGLFVINVMNSVSNEGARGIHVIIWMLAIFMYLTFSIAFLCHKKK